MSDKAKIKSLEIEPLKFDGSVDDFRAWMDGFLSWAGVVTLVNAVPQQEVLRKAFEAHKGGDIVNVAQYYPKLRVKYSEIDRSSQREVWYVYVYNPMTDDDNTPLKRWATILATQTLNQTTVHFLDGFIFRLRDSNARVTENVRAGFIGDDFSLYAKAIRDEWGKRNQEATQPKQEQPLSKVTLEQELEKISSEKWRKAVMLWREGKTAPEIGKIIDRDAKTVANKITMLRKKLGDKVVPYHKDES